MVKLKRYLHQMLNKTLSLFDILFSNFDSIHIEYHQPFFLLNHESVQPNTNNRSYLLQLTASANPPEAHLNRKLISFDFWSLYLACRSRRRTLLKILMNPVTTIHVLHYDTALSLKLHQLK